MNQIVFAVLAIVLILVFLRVIVAGKTKRELAAMRRWQCAVLALGVLVALTGALLMVEGSILGEMTTYIAIVLGIIGIGIIGVFNTIMMWGKAKKPQGNLNSRDLLHQRGRLISEHKHSILLIYFFEIL